MSVVKHTSLWYLFMAAWADWHTHLAIEPRSRRPKGRWEENVRVWKKQNKHQKEERDFGKDLKMGNATIGAVNRSKKTGALDATCGEKTICNPPEHKSYRVTINFLMGEPSQLSCRFTGPPRWKTGRDWWPPGTAGTKKSSCCSRLFTLSISFSQRKLGLRLQPLSTM